MQVCGVNVKGKEGFLLTLNKYSLAKRSVLGIHTKLQPCCVRFLYTNSEGIFCHDICANGTEQAMETLHPPRTLSQKGVLLFFSLQLCIVSSLQGHS